MKIWKCPKCKKSYTWHEAETLPITEVQNGLTFRSMKVICQCETNFELFQPLACRYCKNRVNETGGCRFCKDKDGRCFEELIDLPA